jgi:hypothetical protein
MSDFHKEIRRLEWEFDEGLPWPQILDHTIAKTIAGATYAPFDEIINGYTIVFSGTVERVNLKGSNNNLIDVLIYSGVSVVSNNSAGLQLVSIGSGLSIEENEWLRKLHEAHYHKRKWDKVGNIITIYDSDKTTPLHVFDTNSDMSEITPQ